MYIGRAASSRIRLGAIAVLLMSLVVVLLFPRAGRFIVAKDQFTHADTALILSGDPVRRALAARDLYLQGRIGQILVIPEPPDRSEGELVKLGLMDPNLPPISDLYTAVRVNRITDKMDRD